MITDFTNEILQQLDCQKYCSSAQYIICDCQFGITLNNIE